MTALRLGLFFVLSVLGHWWWTTYGSVLGLAPQLLLVLTVVVAARRGPIMGMGLGFAWGFALDLFSVGLPGASSLALTLTGYLVGTLRRQIDIVSLLPKCVIVAVATWGYFIVLGLLGLAFTGQFPWPGWRLFVLAPLYNCALMPLLHWAWESFTEA